MVTSLFDFKSSEFNCFLKKGKIEWNLLNELRSLKKELI